MDFAYVVPPERTALSTLDVGEGELVSETLDASYKGVYDRVVDPRKPDLTFQCSEDSFFSEGTK